MTILAPGDVDSCFDHLGIQGRFAAGESARLEIARPADRSGYLIFPTPADNEHLTVLALRQTLGVSPSLAGCFFFDHPWYLGEAFGHSPCKPGWHAIRKAPLEDSFNQPVYHAESLRPKDLFLPWASEVVLMVFLTFTRTGERLLHRKHTWTRDRTEQKQFVSLGAFGKKGLFVSSHQVGYKSQGLGICPTPDLRLSL